MIINNLEQMEKIVASNKGLKWDGWDVVSFYESDKARTSKYGAMIGNKWYMIRKFEPSRQGWDIPVKFVR